MDQNLYDQITSLIEKSQKILILAHARVDCDGLGAALSAYLVLKELGREPTVVTNDPAPENLKFLPSIDILQNSLVGNTDFIITIDSSKTSIGKIKYNVENDKVNIIITPKDGSFSANDVSFNQDINKYDLMMVLDTGNLEHLGSIYDKNVEMFYEVPIVNIDHHVSNTDFGQVNLVDSTASSTTEILYEYLSYLEKKYDKKLITENIATLLLAGIITDTGSFQHANTSPRAMETSSKLLDLGARQQEIIKNIYKTKKLSTLKLWGIILSKVQVDPVHRTVWSTINKDDLQEAEADPMETEGIIDDLLTNAPGAEVIFLIKQNPEYVSVSMRSTNNQADVGKLCADNGGGGHMRAAGFKVYGNKPFDQVVSEVISKVQKFQAERLNIHEEEPIVEPIVGPVVKTIVDNKSIKSDNDQPDKSSTKVRQSEQNEQKTTYLDFKKSSKPTDTATAPDVAVETRYSASQDDKKTIITLPTDEPAKKPRKRNRKRRPKKSVVEPVSGPASRPIVEKSDKPIDQPAKQQSPMAGNQATSVMAPPVQPTGPVKVDHSQPITPPPIEPMQPVVVSEQQPAPTPNIIQPVTQTPPNTVVKTQPTTDNMQYPAEISQPSAPQSAPEMPDWLRAEPVNNNADKPAPDVEPV